MGKLDWFLQAKYGAIIHWGLYAIPGGVWQDERAPHGGEWIMKNWRQGIAYADYKQLMAKFNPVDFDAEAYVRFLKDCGFKYLVFTAKHHDGFYYWLVSDNCIVSVCMIGDRAAAYILDFEPVYYVAGADPTFSAIHNYLDAYATWQKTLGRTGYNNFDGDSVMINSNLLTYIYETNGAFGEKLLEFDEVCLSALYSYLYRTAALQIFPRSAYEDLIIDGEALTAEQNHKDSVMYAVFSQQYMLEQYLESKNRKQ